MPRRSHAYLGLRRCLRARMRARSSGRILDRPDERVPLDELALLPEQAVELRRVVRPEPAPEHELLRRRDGRDRVDLEEAELPDGVEDRASGAVQELRADGDAACLLESDDPCADAGSLDGENSRSVRRRRADRNACRRTRAARRPPPRASAPCGRSGRSSSRSRRRTRRRCAPRAGSPRRRARPGSPSPSQRSWHERTMLPDLAEQPADALEHRSPTIVCVFISAHSASSSGPGLVDDLGRDLHLADVVQQRGELCALTVARRRARAGRRR